MRRSLRAAPRSVSQPRSRPSVRPFHPAKPPLFTPDVSKQRAKLHQAVRSSAVGRCCLSTLTPRAREFAGQVDLGRPTGEATEESRAPPTQQQQQQQQQQPSRRELKESVRAAVKAKAALLAQPGIPSADAVLSALKQCQMAANLLVGGSGEAVLPGATTSAAGAATDGGETTRLGANASAEILSLDAEDDYSRAALKPAAGQVPAQLQSVAAGLSEAAHAIALHPPVLMTPAVLELYVNIQATLGRPQSLPDVLGLFATKPRPHAAAARRGGGATAITYTPQRPGRLASAIPARVADAALAAAIAARDMGTAVGVVERTYMAPGFTRNKVVQKVSLPAAAALGAPFAAYMLASQWAATQDAIDPTRATVLATSCILAYIAFTGSMGLIALFTSNDQMRRVTWAPGMALRERWLREEERAALDKIACAWGFREQHRYGEEQGPEWDALRDYIGLKGMVLDKTELMEGMM